MLKDEEHRPEFVSGFDTRICLGRKPMRSILPLLTVLLSCGTYFLAADAQERPLRIAVLNPGPEVPRGFVQRLRELGHVNGKNVLIEARNGGGTPEILPKLVADWVNHKVSLIVANGPTAISAAATATRTIPIVMVGGGDPVLRGFVKNLSIPGGNVTGLSSSAKGLGGKRLELLKEVLPALKRVAILAPRSRTTIAEDLPRTALSLGIDVQIVDLSGAADLDNALGRVKDLRPDAFITVRDLMTFHHAQQIVDYSLRHRLPSMYESEEFVRTGGLISYGVNYRAQWPRAASYVDKILRGANPANLAVEPPQLELVLNLATARQLGVTIPPEILLEANEVIK
jgi:putative tryptophan/tyrosine transport system substrate-binding protein